MAVTNNVQKRPTANLTLREQANSVFTTRIDLPSQQTLCARDLVRPLPSPPRVCVTLDQLARVVVSVPPNTMLGSMVGATGYLVWNMYVAEYVGNLRLY